MKIQKIHHVAYRCTDARATVEFYKKVLNMDLLGAIAEDKVPSTKAPDPYMHIFLDAGDGNILAFFELPNSPPMGRDPSGHRLEVAAWTATPEQIERMKSVAHDMVEEWSRTKRPPRHTAWMHEKEFADAE